MTKDEYRALLSDLGISLGDAARVLGIDEVSSRRYASGMRKIPPPAERFLRYILASKTPVAKVERLLAE